MSDQTPIFLTDGKTFLGPYMVASFDIMRGTRILRELHNAAEVFSVSAADIDAAKRAFAREHKRPTAKPRTRVSLSTGDPGKWQAQYYDASMKLWFDIGDAQTEKSEAESRRRKYLADFGKDVTFAVSRLES